MDVLKDKYYLALDYTSRLNGTACYYNTQLERAIVGLEPSMLKNAPCVLHEVKAGDNLDKLALKYYGNPTYWAIIAQYNNILDPFIELSSKFKTLKIPSISSVEYGDLR